MNAQECSSGGTSAVLATAVRALTLFSGALFMFMATLLPLVGPAGVRTPHSRQNFIAFLAVLLAAWFTALGALLLQRRSPVRALAPMRRWPLGLSLFGFLMAWALFAGWLHT